MFINFRTFSKAYENHTQQQWRDHATTMARNAQTRKARARTTMARACNDNGGSVQRQWRALTIFLDAPDFLWTLLIFLDTFLGLIVFAAFSYIFLRYAFLRTDGRKLSFIRSATLARNDWSKHLYLPGQSAINWHIFSACTFCYTCSL